MLPPKLDYRVYLFFYNKKTAEAVSLFIGGAKRDRTADPLRARQVLSQLSYGPNLIFNFPPFHLLKWWA